jgi:hypothetical protein
MKLSKVTIELCHLTPDQAYKLLKHLCRERVPQKQWLREDSIYVER